ncbi:MAG: hypothetical protein Q9227_004344 [Pyrenula ochraceoflavens]
MDLTLRRPQVEMASISHLYNVLLPIYGPQITSPAIRVLTLDAASDQNRDTIAGTLEVKYLDDAPKYTTLSYVWGDDSRDPQEKIFCNDGYVILVTKNCWSALWHLRKLFGPITIWVDAICINQSKDDPAAAEEMDGQIPLMQRIYSEATESYIWLGEGNKETGTDEAMDFLKQGGLPFRWLIRHWIAKDIPSGNMMALRLAIYLTLRRFTFRGRSHFSGIQDILSGTGWINRLWTMQEGTIPKKSTVVCGEKHIPWISMMCAIEYMDLCHKSLYIMAFITFPLPFINWKRLMLLWQQRHQRESPCEFTNAPTPQSLEANDTLSSQLEEQKKYLQLGKKLAMYTMLFSPVLIIGTWYGILLGFTAVSKRFGKFNFSAVLWPLFIFLGLLSFVIICSFIFIVSNRRTICNSFRSVVLDNTQEHLCMELQSRVCERPEDKLRGIVGLLKSKNSVDLGTAGKVDLGACYQTLFMELLKESGSLNILTLTCRARRGHDLDNCPSWVIDWRRPQAYWFKCLFEHRGRSSRFFKYEIGYQFQRKAGATRDSSSHWSFRLDDNAPVSRPTLIVKGVALDTLEFASESLQTIKSMDEDVSDSIAAFQNSLFDISQGNIKITIDSLAIFAGFCTGIPEPSFSRRKWIAVISADKGEQIMLEVQRRLKLDTSAWKFHKWITNFISERNMVLIRSVNEWGLAATGAQRGDALALVSGVSLPIVLRRIRDRHFEVVGPAFIPSMMDGRQWDRLGPNASDLYLH